MAHNSFRAAYAKHVLQKYLLQKEKNLLGGNDTALPAPPVGDPFLGDTVEAEPNIPIGIVGGGPAGLTTALLLRYVGFTNITILEASPRIGGRVYTYNFPPDQNCPHNYYDVGAMRIPDIETQQSTLNLIDYLNQNGENVPKANYTYSAGNEPSWYEYGTDQTGFDSYIANLLYYNAFPIPKPATTTDSRQITPKSFDEAFQDFINSADQPDQWSTRGWLMKGPPPDAGGWQYIDVEKAETFDTSTGLFDQAFMETICDWYDFYEAKLTQKPWYRIEGGMSALTDALCNIAIKRKVGIFVKSPVTALAASDDAITVTYAGTPTPYGDSNPSMPSDAKFAAVFNTTTFACLQRMDLDGLGLSADNLCGIRALSYDRATKVAIKFSNAWWRRLIPNGGVSGTDLPISNVVYPSWDDGDNAHYTIIVSYSWAQDATRMGSLIPVNDVESTDSDDPLIQLCFRNLAKLWKNAPSAEQLQSMYLAHHAFAWAHDPYTGGAFALFGPGQFEFLYPQFTQPLCGNKLSICGEAVSVHHAWISGAIDSAYNAVYTWCKANGYTKEAQKLLDSPFGLGKGKNTAELDEGLLTLHLRLAKLEQMARDKPRS